jgi:hypothetical protein
MRSDTIISNSNNKYSLEITDTVIIHLDNKTKYNGIFNYDRIDDIDYLGTLNRDENSYSLYNINTGNIEEKIQFSSVGPNGIGQARFVKIYNWDSIFVLRYHTNIIYLLDSSPIVDTKWTISETSSEKFIHNISANFGFKLHYEDDVLSFLNIPNAKVYSKEFWISRSGISFNIKDKKVLNNTGIYPDVYKKGVCFGGYNNNPYRIITNGRLEVFSFSLDNRLFVYNDTSLIKTVSIRSKHVKNDAPKPSKTLTGYNYEDAWMYEIQRGSYRYLWYDKSHNLIYRLVVHAMQPYDTDGNKNNFWDKSFSIQIIDSTFNLIGEVDFPEKTYSIYNIFPMNDGLLISLCHDNNPILEEDKLKLALFKLVKTNE